MPIGIPSKEAKVEIEIRPVIGKLKWESVQYILESYIPFCAFYSPIHFALISCSIYIFWFKFLTQVLNMFIYILIVYFQLNQELSISQ